MRYERYEQQQSKVKSAVLRLVCVWTQSVESGHHEEHSGFVSKVHHWTSFVASQGAWEFSLHLCEVRHPSWTHRRGISPPHLKTWAGVFQASAPSGQGSTTQYSPGACQWLSLGAKEGTWGKKNGLNAIHMWPLARNIPEYPSKSLNRVDKTTSIALY